jgi:hypothetical protein
MPEPSKPGAPRHLLNLTLTLLPRWLRLAWRRRALRPAASPDASGFADTRPMAFRRL